MTDFSDFDRFVDEAIAAGSTASVPELFGEWLASVSGQAIVGGPVGEAPEFVAAPDQEEGA